MSPHLPVGSVWTGIGQLIVSPLLLLVDPKSRLFIPFLISSGALALLAKTRRYPWPQVRAGLRLDAQLFFISAWLSASLAPLAAAWTSRATTYVALPLTGYVYDRLGSTTVWSSIELNLAYGVALFFVDDASRYLVHRLMHHVPFLFSLHKVHHSAETLTPLAFYRTHPLETLLYGLRHLLCVALVSAVFLAVLRGQFSKIEPLAYYLVVAPFLLLGANLRHSSSWLGFGPVLERYFISPAQHQIHHGKSAHDQMSNFGSVLALWDRLGGSWQGASSRSQPEFGLAEGDRNHEGTLLSALFDPLFSTLGPLFTWKKLLPGWKKKAEPIEPRFFPEEL